MLLKMMNKIEGPDGKMSEVRDYICIFKHSEVGFMRSLRYFETRGFMPLSFEHLEATSSSKELWTMKMHRSRSG